MLAKNLIDITAGGKELMHAGFYEVTVSLGILAQNSPLRMVDNQKEEKK